MPRAWVELPADATWGEARMAISALVELGYFVAEIRGGRVWLRVSVLRAGTYRAVGDATKLRADWLGTPRDTPKPDRGMRTRWRCYNEHQHRLAQAD